MLDDEYKWSETVGDFYLPVTGLPELATLSLLTIGGLAVRRGESFVKGTGATLS